MTAWGVPPQPEPTHPYRTDAPPPYGFRPAEPSSPLAMIAMFLGIFSIAFFWTCGPGFVFAIPAMILARIEIRRIGRREAPESNRRYARIGFWCGAGSATCSALLALAYLALMFGNAFFNAYQGR
jgi:hypothetical protein